MKQFVALTLAAGLLVLAGCKKDTTGSVPMGEKKQPVAGVSWSVPKRWVPGGERPMRIATYAIPAAEGDAEGAECAVFYFGEGAGGDVTANIDRWVGQFEPTSGPDRGTKEVNGMQVTTVRIGGAYLNPSGPMMQSMGKKPGYRLLGAIVAGPQGSVFFKMTGPEKTIASAEGEFEALVESLSK
jgi:hypothetical protein